MDAAFEIGDQFVRELIELRREIHRLPELAGNERRTAALVSDRLRAAGLSVTNGVGGHGVVGVLAGAGEGPTIAFRADLDAVADDELSGLEFASQVPGAAHLCGHDLHTAIGVGIAQLLARMRDRIDGRVLFVFQPAEETLEGARAMIEDGVLERHAPREIYALHCGPLPVGEFAVMPGFGQPGQDQFEVTLSGPGAAASGSQLADQVLGLSTVRPPRTPREQQQLNDDLTTPNGPLATFVFAQSELVGGEGDVRLRVSVRAWPDSRYTEVREQVRELVEATAAATADFRQAPFPAMVCSAPLSEAAGTYLRGVDGIAAVHTLHAAFPFNGEDFALFLDQVPGAMFFLGVANAEQDLNGIPHSPHFGADERALALGARAMAGFLLSRLAASSPDRT